MIAGTRSSIASTRGRVMGACAAMGFYCAAFCGTPSDNVPASTMRCDKMIVVRSAWSRPAGLKEELDASPTTLGKSSTWNLAAQTKNYLPIRKDLYHGSCRAYSAIQYACTGIHGDYRITVTAPALSALSVPAWFFNGK